ncbi:MOSC domain-containing protein [Agrobacterium sp. AGB01]|uniref:MOSC domain-containing protein n=1 Tax=Agrobacterium sp. AGB01 TaxID=2769302 RepID=UPI0035303282
MGCARGTGGAAFRYSLPLLGAPGFPESEWLDAVLYIGGTTVKVFELTERCAKTFISPPGIDKDPEILRNIVRRNRRTLGVYCQVEAPGKLEAGSHVVILPGFKSRFLM